MKQKEISKELIRHYFNRLEKYNEKGYYIYYYQN